MMPGPIGAAYEQTGALTVMCPNCGAGPGGYCSHTDGRLRRTPCVARCAGRCDDNTTEMESPDPDPDPDPAETIPGPVMPNVPDYVDITEPRHPREDD